MRWIWIDRFVEFEPGKRAVAVKNVSLAEDVLHDHFPASPRRPAFPVMPNTLVIEGMAQTAGILVGHARNFAEKVILAKIGHAEFFIPATPGYTLRYTAVVERLDVSGASTNGQVDLIDPATGQAKLMGRIELMFSHIDQNRAGLEFPEHNFVFSGDFLGLLERSGIKLGHQASV